MPGSLAAAFFPSVCRRFQDGGLKAEHRFAFPDDVRETAAAGVLRQGFHPARPSPRGSGHPADQLAFSAFMSNSMSWSSVNATICATTATFPSTGTGPVKFAISVQAPRPGQARQTASSPGGRTVVLCLLRGLYVSAVSSGILQPMRTGTCLSRRRNSPRRS